MNKMDIITDDMVYAWYIGDESLFSIYYALKEKYDINDFSAFADAMFSKSIKMFGHLSD